VASAHSWYLLPGIPIWETAERRMGTPD